MEKEKNKFSSNWNERVQIVIRIFTAQECQIEQLRTFSTNLNI